MFASPYQKLSKAAEKKLFVLAILIFLLAGSCMIHFDSFLQNEVAPFGIISFELTRTVTLSVEILTSWHTIPQVWLAAERSLWFDYIFMISYALLLTLLIHKTAKTLWKRVENIGYRLGIVLLRATFFAAFLDAVENVALLQLFYGDIQQHWVSLGFTTALLKFIILTLGITYILVSLAVAGIKKYIHVKK